MTNKFKTVASAALLAAAAIVPAGQAHAFKLSDLDPTKIIRAVTQAKVNVHNHYSFPITVVMDSNREVHTIAAGGVATFTKANKGDKPTFHAKDNNGNTINSKQVFLDGNKTVNFG